MTPLQFGVIGLRSMGGVHVREIVQHTHARLTAVVDTDEALVRTTAEQHNAQPYTDYRRMLDEQRLDAVVIATPHMLHAPMALDALDAGAHVFVEKPIANRVSEADRMVRLAAERNLVLAVGHNYRTFPGNIMLKRLIDGGQIGPVSRVHWQWLENRPEAYYKRDIWRCTWRHSGGGVLMNQTSHDLDLFCWLMGAPVEVSAMIGNRGHEHEVEDTAIACIRFDNGAYATVQLSTCSTCLNSRHIWGEDGEIIFQDTRNANVHTPETFRLGRYHTSIRETIRTDANVTGQPDVTWEDLDCSDIESPTLLDSFITAIFGDGRPITDGASGLRTLELINAIILSGVRKTVVPFPVDRAAYDEVFDALSTGRIKIEGNV